MKNHTKAHFTLTLAHPLVFLIIRERGKLQPNYGIAAMSIHQTFENFQKCAGEKLLI